MFAYNKLSDLKTGELVVPINKNGENIICTNSLGETVTYAYGDFDFDKLESDRTSITIEDIANEMEADINDADKELEILKFISSSINLNFNMSHPFLTIIRNAKEKSSFITDNIKKKELLNFFDISYKNVNSINIYDNAVSI